MKKMMLLALAAVSALLALPAFASAAPVHVQTHAGGNPGAFTVAGGASELVRSSGGGTKGETVSGNGTFENTTTGTVKLTFGKVKSETLGDCASTAEGHSRATGPGTVTTTTLPFHLITTPTGNPAILITSNIGHFASFTCGGIGIGVTVNGNGIIGTITAPACGGTSTTATLSFTQAGGIQNHKTYTGVSYNLTSTILGSASESGMTAHATVTFGGARTLICT
ncbi:MAG TPA: hypothetical protein VLI94_01840 [Solirubrobacterales bacterium]|nr:hypothetical protein [Solirubrobacterales bacterium]